MPNYIVCQSFPKQFQNVPEYKIILSNIAQDFFNFGKSGEILANLVTLILERKIKKWNKFIFSRERESDADQEKFFFRHWNNFEIVLEQDNNNNNEEEEGTYQWWWQWHNNGFPILFLGIQNLCKTKQALI